MSTLDTLPRHRQEYRGEVTLFGFDQYPQQFINSRRRVVSAACSFMATSALGVTALPAPAVAAPADAFQSTTVSAFQHTFGDRASGVVRDQVLSYVDEAMRRS